MIIETLQGETDRERKLGVHGSMERKVHGDVRGCDLMDEGKGNRKSL